MGEVPNGGTSCCGTGTGSCCKSCYGSGVYLCCITPGCADHQTKECCGADPQIGRDICAHKGMWCSDVKCGGSTFPCDPDAEPTLPIGAGGKCTGFYCNPYWYCNDGTCNTTTSNSTPYFTKEICEATCAVPTTYYVCSGVPGSRTCNVSLTVTPYTNKTACESACWTDWLYTCSGSPLYICSAGTTGISQANCEINRLPGGSCTAPIPKYTCSGSTGTGGHEPYTCYETTPIGSIFSLCNSSCVAPPPDKWTCSGSPSYNCTSGSIGTYATFDLCKDTCKAPPLKWTCSGSPSYNCTSGSTGLYASPEECASACKALPTRWSCIDNLCTESAPGGTGTWSNQSDCINANTCGTWNCVSDSCSFSSNDNTGYTSESSCRTNCDKVWCCKATCGCTSGCGTTSCQNLTAVNCGAGVTTYSTQSECTTNQPCCDGSHYECKFKDGSTSDSPGNKECLMVTGARDSTNPNHFSTESACKNDCGNSYYCNNCDCIISKGLNGAEIFSTCDTSCPDKTYRCDDGKCIKDICPSSDNPGLTYADCKLQCGKYVCAGSNTTTGTVLAWGFNNYNQCDIPASASSGVSAIAGGSVHTIALKDGEVLAWGRNVEGQCTIPTAAQSGVSAIAGGGDHTIALKDGAVLAWGFNGQGQCTIPASASSGVSAIAGGSVHTIALKGGAVLAWGYNVYGQCTIPASANSGVTAIAGGGYFSIALKDGAVLAWGDNRSGQCDIPASASSGVSAIAGGAYHTVALKDGAVLAWGLNNYGQCNIPAAALSGVSAIACGDYYTIALKNGAVLAWGLNNYGQCTIPASASSGVTAIAAGREHTIAVTGIVTTATKCEFYGDTSSGYDTNALCEANTPCHIDPKYECVYTQCSNGRVLGSTCSPTIIFVEGVTYYDTFTECEASACADIVDQGNRWKCVNNDCVFINYCDGDGTYKEVSGPNGCQENCWGWNCKNNHCSNEQGATNNHENCADSCHCQWYATVLRNPSGEYCPACEKVCGKVLASRRIGDSETCSDQWGTYCPESNGYFNTEFKCKEYLTQDGGGEYTCKENGTCEAIDPNFPVETPCGKYCSKNVCEAACKPAVLGYVCVEPPVPYSGRPTCKQLTNCSSIPQFDTMEQCINSCDYIVSRGWNCNTSDNGKSTCVALTTIEEGIPQFTSSVLCNRFCINNFGWNCKGNQCIRAWEAPGSFSSYVQCANTCIIPDQGPCGNVVDTITGSVNNGGSAA